MNCIIYDLETTCWKSNPNGRREREIIEIGAVKLNDQFSIIDEFQQFVRPTINRHLTKFCIELTSITQNDVKAAEPLEIVIRQFEAWIVNEGQDFQMISWGQFDKDQILKECTLKRIETPMESILQHHVNLKYVFAKKRKMKQFGMSTALKILSITLEGSHHRGIDDARNTRAITLTDTDGGNETNCRYFAETFWKAFGNNEFDNNHDGKVSVREAYDVAIKEHKSHWKKSMTLDIYNAPKSKSDVILY